MKLNAFRWTDSAIKNFHDKTKCLIQQYNKYMVTDIGQAIDGESTQGWLNKSEEEILNFFSCLYRRKYC